MSGKKFFAIALVAALVLVLALPEIVSAKSAMKVPAVDAGGEGILTEVSVEVKPGTGEEFVNIVPFFSVETQQSSKSAISAAASLAKAERRKYDYFIKIVANAEVVDGPSGGAALGVLAYAELTGKKVRGDFTATGSISSDGGIGKVGGIFKKAEAAAKLGMKVFAVPVDQAVQDGVDLTTYAPAKWGLQVVEAAKLEELVKIAFTPEGSSVEAPERKIIPLELGKLNDTTAAQPLKKLAEEKLEQARRAALELNKSQPNSPLANQSFRELNTSAYQFSQGYYYSAANTAFLVLVSLHSARLANATKQALLGQIAELQARAKAVAVANKTTSNLEWAFASELRKFWALQRLEEATDRAAAADNLAALGQAIAAATQWLESVDDFNKAAEGIAAGASGAVPIDESKLRQLAAKKIAEAGNASAATPDTEALFHLSAARRAFSNAAYLTAVVDAVFASSFARALAEHGDKTSEEALAEIRNSSFHQQLKSAWAQQYFSHALYNAAEWRKSGDVSALLNALKLQKLAIDLEQLVSKEIPLELGKPLEEAVPASTTATPGGGGSGGGDGSGRGEGPSTIQISVQPLSKRGQPFDAKLFVAGALLVLLVSVAGLLYAIQQKREEFRSSPGARRLESERKLDHLDEMLVAGKISEKNYERLKEKYEQLLKQYAGQPVGKTAKRTARS